MMNGEASEGSLRDLGKGFCVTLEVWSDLFFSRLQEELEKEGKRGRRDRQFWVGVGRERPGG
jgi:hypothetical protein